MSRPIFVCGPAVLAVLLNTAMAADSTRDDAIQSAKEALSHELGIDAMRFAVVDVEPVEWRDGSLGCPRTGMYYTQALSYGYRVVLRVAAASYDVHVAGERVVVCDSTGSAPKSGDAEGAAASVRMAQLARRDLATRLQLDTSEVSVEGVRPVRWPDASLGCPMPGQNYETVATPGFVIELSAGAARYTYHADRERVMLCKPMPVADRE